MMCLRRSSIIILSVNKHRQLRYIFSVLIREITQQPFCTRHHLLKISISSVNIRVCCKPLLSCYVLRFITINISEVILIVHHIRTIYFMLRHSTLFRAEFISAESERIKHLCKYSFRFIILLYRSVVMVKINKGLLHSVKMCRILVFKKIIKNTHKTTISKYFLNIALQKP